MSSIDQVLAVATENNRVCPQPKKWQQLYELLPNKTRKGAGWEPALPLILAAWWDTPAMSKMLRLREHIEWAAAHGCLEQVHEFMQSLAEEEWHHLGE
jgi:hypothetical protein